MSKKKPGIMTPVCNLRAVDDGIPGVPEGQLLAAYVMGDGLLFKGSKRLPEVFLPYERAMSFRIVDEEELRDKSAIGRAAVGGLLLGPLGAVIGAASGAGQKRGKRSFLNVRYFDEDVNTCQIAAEVVSMPPSSLARFVKALSRRVQNEAEPDPGLAGRRVTL